MMEGNEENEGMSSNEEKDRAGQRILLGVVTFLALLTIFLTVWLFLHYNQAQLLGETIKAILYVVAGIGSAITISRFQSRR